MPFDQSQIRDILCSPRNGDLLVSWASGAPAGSWYQIYLDRRLVWRGRTTFAVIPHPVGTVRVEVGTVLSGEARQNLASTLPAVPGGGSRVMLTWQGGTFLDPLIQGFHVYIGDAPGGPIDYSEPVATVTAYPQGRTSDGWGQGGFGAGGFGRSAATYTWTSNPLAAGVWNTAVVPFDSAGNEGTGSTSSVTVSGPPRPVARNAAGKRLTYTITRGTAGGFGTGGWGQGGFGAGTGFGDGGFGLGGFGVGSGEGLPSIVLSWLASPGA